MSKKGIHQEDHQNYNVFRMTVLIAIFVIIEKIVGFVREAIIAANFGTTPETDAFFFAQAMPGMLFPAVGNSIALAFTPLLVEKIVKNTEQADKYVAKVLFSVLGLGIVMGVIGALLSPILVPLLAPGFSDYQVELAISMSKITMLFFFFALMQYILGAVLDAKKTPIFNRISGLSYSLVIIILVLVFSKNADVKVLTFSVMAAIVVHFVCSLYFVCRTVRIKFICPRLDDDIKCLFLAALPIFLGNSVTQINGIVDKIICSSLSEGSLSALNYASTLQMVVVDVFVITLTSVIYPIITEHVLEDDAEALIMSVTRCINVLICILVPISIIVLLDAKSIVTIAFFRGKFDLISVGTTGLVLACYSMRFPFVGIREVLTRVFFAMKNTRLPMIIGSVGIGINVILSIITSRIIGIAGIALSTTMAGIIISVLLLVFFKKHFGDFKIKTMLIPFAKEFAAGGGMAIVLLLIRKVLIINSSFLQFGIDTILGMLTYALLLFVLKSNEIKYVILMIRGKKLWK